MRTTMKYYRKHSGYGHAMPLLIGNNREGETMSQEMPPQRKDNTIIWYV